MKKYCIILQYILILVNVMIYGGYAQCSPMVVDLSERVIDLTSNFTGKDILVFGAFDGEVKIIVRGPKKDVFLNKKGYYYGIWINQERNKLQDVDLICYVLDSNGEKEGKEVLPYIRDMCAANMDVTFLHNAKDNFQEFVNLNYKRGLYRYDAKHIILIGEHLFKAVLRFSNNIVRGEYFIEVYFYDSSGLLKGMKIMPLVVKEEGIDSWILYNVKNHKWFYALCAICIALFVGWCGFISSTKRNV